MHVAGRDEPEGSSSAQVKSVWTDLTDAQKYSLIAIGVSIGVTAILWSVGFLIDLTQWYLTVYQARNMVREQMGHRPER